MRFYKYLYTDLFWMFTSIILSVYWLICTYVWNSSIKPSPDLIQIVSVCRMNPFVINVQRIGRMHFQSLKKVEWEKHYWIGFKSISNIYSVSLKKKKSLLLPLMHGHQYFLCVGWQIKNVGKPPELSQQIFINITGHFLFCSWDETFYVILTTPCVFLDHEPK